MNLDQSPSRWTRRVFQALITFTAVAAVSAVSAPAAHADVMYPVAWTKIGIYPRTAPSMDAAHAGPVLKDGTMVTFVCEQQGQTVFNGDRNIDVWAKISTGGWLPTAFINTKVDGWTPGVPKCNEPSKPAPAPQNTPSTPKVVNCGGSNPYIARIDTEPWPHPGDFQINVTPKPAARDNPGNRDVVVSMWHQVQSCVPGLYDRKADSVWQQLECHQMLSWFGGGELWELESWVPPLKEPNFGSYTSSECLNIFSK
ncbi:hypothetical protein ACFV24_27110 [Nocardia fluminea]|uniref:hypothetical protein n=1 Tax=Nocardia fluminea TaxID=134984 RepID=UPI003670D43C